MFHCSAHPGATQPIAGVEQRIKDSQFPVPPSLLFPLCGLRDLCGCIIGVLALLERFCVRKRCAPGAF
jgi:hypothetical protein